MNLQLLSLAAKKSLQSNTEINLPKRVRGLLSPAVKKTSAKQGQLALEDTFAPEFLISTPTNNILYFLDFLVDALPFGDVYLFGGVLRELAMIGRLKYESDLDIVIDNDWERAEEYLIKQGAQKNKFGGYRIKIAQFDVDIWEAKSTWAITQGYVNYEGIHSLLETTILNWDSILMDWRTKHLITDKTYFENVKKRYLDVVLLENPDPLGMAVRAFKHLSKKEAKYISKRASKYLANCTNQFNLIELLERERKSYGSISINPVTYRFFTYLKQFEYLGSAEKQFEEARKLTKIDLGEIPELML